MSKPSPTISCAENGPYLLKNDASSTVTLYVSGPDGETVSSVHGISLCRCGGSGNKPFCDGTHRKNGFNDRNQADAENNRQVSYTGESITIHDNRSICAHAGYCTDQLSSVFKMGEEPWIDPDGASIEEIVELVKQCPSGALSCTVETAKYSNQEPKPRIKVLEDGPYAVSEIALTDRELGTGATSARYTLCRCGASKNKPFCDGSHWYIGFKG